MAANQKSSSNHFFGIKSPCNKGLFLSAGLFQVQNIFLTKNTLIPVELQLNTRHGHPLGLGQGKRNYQIKFFGTSPTRHVVESVQFGLGKTQFFMYNFRIGSGFFEFQVKIFAPNPVHAVVGLAGSDCF